VHTNQIQLLHAHSSSLFIAAIVSRFPPPKGKPHPSVIWHDHFGRHMVEDRPAWLYRLAAKHVSGVIAVNQPLAEWSQRKLHIPANRVWYIPNFVCEVRSNGAISGLPGKAGQRIVCVANLRSEKDHLTLLRAMALVIRQVPTAHLLLAGATIDRSYVDLLHNEISRNGLSQNVSLLGQRQDVEAMLRACDIGVLSSASEGLPLALMEYGMAGLPVVATRVGQCAEVLDQGRVGILVPPGAPEQLAEALLDLLYSPSRRAALGQKFQRHVKDHFSPEPVIMQICQVYDTVLESKKRPG
jgi:glycosyltransferase involved in cell wall biosynthesis